MTLIEAGERERTVSSYFSAFAPTPEWDELVWWPPDVFALANLVLDHTHGYRFVVAPPHGRTWPPLQGWNARVCDAAREWKHAAGHPRGEPPPLVRQFWETVTRYRDFPLAKVRSGETWDLATALLGLHAIADEACAGVVSSEGYPPDSFEAAAWTVLQATGSLSMVSPTRVRIVPKTHSSSRGITIRSLSRYLALCYESVELRWRSIGQSPTDDPRDYHLVLAPWPLSVNAGDFCPAPPALLENMDRDVFGFFEFAPEPSVDCDLLASLLEAAVARAGRVDAVVFPEAAVHPGALAGLERTLAEHGATFLIAGVREPPAKSVLGRNYLHFGVRTDAGWTRYEQDKHHRWCLDEGQIRQYHLTRSLDPKKLWWEAIDVRERMLHIIDVGGRVTTAPMVCEDLASLDEVADLVRRIGPSLVVALLLDGPQLSSRWPCRYASVLADDPGSAVLTLTSLGMAVRSRPPGTRPSRVIAHWNSSTDGIREIELARGASAVLLSTTVAKLTLWTADGRSHGDVPRLTLSGVHQLAGGVDRKRRRRARAPSTGVARTTTARR